MIPKEANCSSCERGGRPRSYAEEELLNSIVSWRISRNGVHLLRRSFVFDSHTDALEFSKIVTIIVDAEQSSLSSLQILDQTVSIELSTRSIGGLTESDFIIASVINDLYALAIQPLPVESSCFSEDVCDTPMPMQR